MPRSVSLFGYCIMLSGGMLEPNLTVSYCIAELLLLEPEPAGGPRMLRLVPVLGVDWE